METDEADSTVGRPAPATSAEKWDELVRQLLIERFGSSPCNPTVGYPQNVSTGFTLSTGIRSDISPSGDQVHPEITTRTPRRSR